MAARTKSDKVSGVGVFNPKDYPEHTEDELETHWSLFKDFDLDDSGFISPTNLHAIMQTFEVDVTETAMINMITEVAILCNHEDDGKLSFRDYMRCLDYEKEKEAHNESIAAAEEMAELGLSADARDEAVVKDPRSSIDARASARAEAERLSATEPVTPEAEAAAEAAKAAVRAAESITEDSMVVMTEETSKWRGTTLAVLIALVKPRLLMAEAIQEEAMMEAEPTIVASTPPPVSTKEENFNVRLAKFKKIDSSINVKGFKPPNCKDENIHKATMKNKLAAFEAAKQNAKSEVVFKKTWKQKGSSATIGSYNKKSAFMDKDGNVLGPKPKVDLATLLAN